MDYYEWNDLNPKNTDSAGKIFNVLKNVSIVAIALSILYILTFLGWENDGLKIFYNILIILLIELPLFGCFFIFRNLMKKYFDYDYFIIGDILRIVKISNKIARKSVAEFNLCDIENIGIYGSSSYEQAKSVIPKRQSLACNMEIEHIYIVAVYDGQRQLFILDYNYEFLCALRKAMKRELVFDKDLILKLQQNGVEEI